MASVGDAYDNAMAEIILATLECERLGAKAHNRPRKSGNSRCWQRAGGRFG
jgi:hypothetical protein